MSNWKKNKALARTKNTKPTLTDQSAAADTDRTVIVKRYLAHGQVMGTSSQPIAGADFTLLPKDLIGFIERGRSLAKLRAKLPPQLRSRSTEELLSLTAEQLTAILTPPAPKPDDTGAK